MKAEPLLRSPQDQPDFNPLWVEAYEMSPTVKPEQVQVTAVLRNPDPNGFLIAQAEQRVEAEAEDDVLLWLLDEEGPQSRKRKEEREGEETVIENKKITEINRFNEVKMYQQLAKLGSKMAATQLGKKALAEGGRLLKSSVPGAVITTG